MLNHEFFFTYIPLTYLDYRVSRNYLDWAKYQNRHSSKSVWVMKLFFWQNDCPIRGEFWQKNSFITHILFELCLFWYLAQSTYLWDTLYIYNIFKRKLNLCQKTSNFVSLYWKLDNPYYHVAKARSSNQIFRSRTSLPE